MSYSIGIFCVALIAICLISELVFLFIVIREENADRHKLFEPLGNSKTRK